MITYQIFAIIDKEDVKNIIVSDYEMANQMARKIYGGNAFAKECTYYNGVSIGSKYKSGIFYTKGGEIIEYIGTEIDNINILKEENKQQKIDNANMEFNILDNEFRISELEDAIKGES